MNTLTDLLDAITGSDSLLVVITGFVMVAILTAFGLMVHRASRAVARGNWAGRRVLILVAVLVAFAVAGIGGVQSFRAVSDKFDSALVPLVADGMVVACTALRLAALTRGWRIPGALLTTYVFIGGTVALNIDAANGAVDAAIAHALAPLAYAVLVEMLAHMLRLHLKLSQPARAKLSALTWFTSPVITTRVWLHLARTGATDPVEARALVQQVVRMSSRLSTVCPSRRGLPLDAARAARSAALQTIRDGLLSAGELAALLPTSGRMTAGELLALVDSAALGISRKQTVPIDEHTEDQGARPPGWMVGYVVGALQQQRTTRTAPKQSTHAAPNQSTDGAPAPVHHDPITSAPAPVHHPAAPSSPNGSSVTSAPVAESVKSGAGSKAKRSDESYLAELLAVSRAEHGGQALSQREITRVTGVGFPKARRLAELAGWVETSGDNDAAAHAVNNHPDRANADAHSNDRHPEQPPDHAEQTHELEMSNSR